MLTRGLEVIVAGAVAALLVAFAVELWRGPQPPAAELAGREGPAPGSPFARGGPGELPAPRALDDVATRVLGAIPR